MFGPPLLSMWWRLHITWLRGGNPPGCRYIQPIDWWEILLLPWWLMCPCCVQPCFAHFHSADCGWSYSLFQSSNDEPSCRSHTTCALCRVFRRRSLLSPMFCSLPLSPTTRLILFRWRCWRHTFVVHISAPSRSWVPSRPCLRISVAPCPSVFHTWWYLTSYPMVCEKLLGLFPSPVWWSCTTLYWGEWGGILQFCHCNPRSLF